MKKSKKQKGFSLIEVLIASFIISLSYLLIAQISMGVVKQSKSGLLNTQITYTHNHILNYFRNIIPFSQVNLNLSTPLGTNPYSQYENLALHLEDNRLLFIYWDDTNYQIKVKENTLNQLNQPLDTWSTSSLSSPNLKVTDLEFYLSPSVKNGQDFYPPYTGGNITIKFNISSPLYEFLNAPLYTKGQIPFSISLNFRK